MKIVLDVEETKQLEKGDIIVYRQGCWKTTSKTNYLAETNEEIKKLKNRIAELEQTLIDLAKIVKEK